MVWKVSAPGRPHLARPEHPRLTVFATRGRTIVGRREEHGSQESTEDTQNELQGGRLQLDIRKFSNSQSWLSDTHPGHKRLLISASTART